MILTTADVAEKAAIEFQQSNNAKGGDHFKRKASSMLTNDGIPHLEIVGPSGTKSFLHSLRHFMRRDRFNIHTYEGHFDSSKLNNTQQKHPEHANKRAKKKIQKDNEETSFNVKSIPVDYTIVSNALETAQSHQITKQAISYVFTTPKLPGKFLIEKARKLNVPMGPLCGQLKAGKSVTFIDSETNEEKTVDSKDVLAKESPGVGVAVVYCPTLQVLAELRASETLRAFEKSATNDVPDAQLDAIVHLTPKAVFESDAYQSWCDEFGSEVDHITLHVAERVKDSATNNNASPFVSGMRGGFRRSYVHDGIFPMPEIPVNTCEVSKRTKSFIEGCHMMEYLLIPRSKRGLNTCTMNSLYSTTEKDDLREEVLATGALQLAKTVASEQEAGIQVDEEGNKSNLGELIFSGTGSAVPCKHRNVTGMYLRMSNGNSMLLDVGEGTVGQLLQVWKSALPKSVSAVDEYHSRLLGIKAVWISHPHADHHLGLLRLLSERSAIGGSNDPIVLMAPPNMFAFLSEYQLTVPEIKGSYVELDCRDLFPGGRQSRLCSKLREDLGISCTAVQVTHCPYSYAVIVDGTAFGRLAYSGDCRPSTRFALAGNGADVLIHEATFEDGMTEEAVLKKHSTVGEAIEIACKMDAKTLILTHFSQRYPKIPSVNRNESDAKAMSVPIAFAFDLMKVTPSSLPLATKLTPALRLLYPGQEEDVQTEAKSDVMVDSKELMAVPGMFSAQGIL